MQKEIVATEEAPKAIGPYSQAVRVGSLVFLSGQIPLDPSTGEISGGDAAEQTRRVMENLRAVLRAAGVGFSEVVRSTIYLTDLRDLVVAQGKDYPIGRAREQPFRSRPCRVGRRSRST
jgi:2-iminobutanoate/2-iminopropanoate deaminase